MTYEYTMELKLPGTTQSKPSLSWPNFNSMEILNEYDYVPYFFAVTMNDKPHLWYWSDCDETRKVDRYLVVPTTKETIKSLVELNISLYDALFKDESVELRYADVESYSSVLKTSVVELKDIPKAYKPLKGVKLHPER